MEQSKGGRGISVAEGEGNLGEGLLEFLTSLLSVHYCERFMTVLVPYSNCGFGHKVNVFNILVAHKSPKIFMYFQFSFLRYPLFPSPPFLSLPLFGEKANFSINIGRKWVRKKRENRDEREMLGQDALILLTHFLKLIRPSVLQSRHFLVPELS